MKRATTLSNKFPRSRYTITPRDLDLTSVGNLLTARYSFSKNQIEKAARENKIQIKRNGILLDFNKNLPINIGDQILIYSKISSFDQGIKHEFWDERTISNLILYHDEKIIALNKPNGIELTKFSANELRTLINCGLTKPWDKLQILNKIEKQASGVLIISRDEHMTKSLQAALVNSNNPKNYSIDTKNNRIASVNAFGKATCTNDGPDKFDNSAGLNVKKTYLAVLSNLPSRNHGSIIDYISFTHPSNELDLFNEDSFVNFKNSNLQVKIRHIDSEPKSMWTHIAKCELSYRVVKKIVKRGTLVEIRPSTCRYHQIRFQMAKKSGLNSPILGDKIYGIKSPKKLEDLGWNRSLLFNDNPPLFLHLGNIMIENYYQKAGSKNKDLMLNAPFPELWNGIV